MGFILSITQISQLLFHSLNLRSISRLLNEHIQHPSSFLNPLHSHSFLNYLPEIKVPHQLFEDKHTVFASDKLLPVLLHLIEYLLLHLLVPPLHQHLHYSRSLLLFDIIQHERQHRREEVLGFASSLLFRCFEEAGDGGQCLQFVSFVKFGMGSLELSFEFGLFVSNLAVDPLSLVVLLLLHFVLFLLLFAYHWYVEEIELYYNLSIKPNL